MSRYEIRKNNKGLAFGVDHACGEYLQIWDLTKGYSPDADNILVDEDVLLTGLTREKMKQLLAEHGFDLSELSAEMKRHNGGV